MKKHLTCFLAGVLCTTLVFGCGVAALAATGRMSIEIDPVNIKVNNEIFQPKDAKGNDVMVFAYNGTTYAPLRALAEAYGLQVGWDQASGTATVVDPNVVQPTTAPDTPSSSYNWTAEEEAAYQEFKGMWEYTNNESYLGTADAVYNGTMTSDELKAYLEHIGAATVTKFAYRTHASLIQEQGFNCTLRFFYNRDTLILMGVAYADGEHFIPTGRIFKWKR